jgi:predicted GIY-YIG superfamily endonuclease
MVGTLVTYIIKTFEGEYYCGKTNDLNKRIEQHIKENSPHWFSFKQRRNFIIVFKCNNDYEKNIKSFGVKKFIECIKDFEVSLP